MFAGIDTARAWPSTGMTSAKWLEVYPRLVNIGNLTMTQDGIYFKALLEKNTPVGGDPYPHVVCWNGTSFLEDGHTRVVRALINGLTMIKARVIFI
jgi:hypothetical protein